MRIISGKYKGKRLLGNNLEQTRPTKDRTKESLFAMIQDNISDSVCLDLFAGTGTLGLEAISNGAKIVYFNELNQEPLRVLKQNLKKITEDYDLLQCDYALALKEYHQANLVFDFIFLDPPYGFRSLDKLLRKIKEYKLLKPDGMIILETDKSDLKVLTFDIINQKKYGKSHIYFLKHK